MWDLIVSVPDRCLSFYFSEKEVAQQNKCSISGSSARNTCSISRMNPYHVFIDSKKTFDRLFHEALLPSLATFNIKANTIQENL